MLRCSVLKRTTSQLFGSTCFSSSEPLDYILLYPNVSVILWCFLIFKTKHCFHYFLQLSSPPHLWTHQTMSSSWSSRRTFMSCSIIHDLKLISWSTSWPVWSESLIYLILQCIYYFIPLFSDYISTHPALHQRYLWVGPTPPEDFNPDLHVRNCKLNHCKRANSNYLLTGNQLWPEHNPVRNAKAKA